MISDILAPTIDGDRLTEREFKNFFVLLVSAGNDTTRYTMAAGMKALIERPDQLAELRDSVIAGDDRADGLRGRGDPPLGRRSRCTSGARRQRDTELARIDTIRRGDKVVIWFNSRRLRRPPVSRPVQFDIHRTPERRTLPSGG